MRAVRWSAIVTPFLMAACDSDNAPPPPASDAEMAYRTACASCHRWDGAGLEGLYPPLADTDWVRETDPAALIRIVLHGMVGPVHVNGAVFRTSAPIMPGQGAMLPDERIAEVLTFVLQRFGERDVNVTAEQVAKVREAEKGRAVPWTEKELRSAPD